MSKRFGISMIVTVDNDAAIQELVNILGDLPADSAIQSIVLSPAYLLPEAADGEATKAD